MMPHVPVDHDPRAGSPNAPPPKPPGWNDRYWWRYSQTGRWKWYATWGQNGWIGGFGLSASTEKRLRRKIARHVWKERRLAEMQARTRVERPWVAPPKETA